MIDWSVIPPICPKCNKPMQLAYHKQIITGGEWLCRFCLKSKPDDLVWQFEQEKENE